MANAKRVHDMLEDSDNLPEWVQSKITKAEDYMSTVANYLSAEMSEEVKQIEEAIEVKKEYNDKTEAEHGVYHKGKKIGYVVHHKPSGTHTAYHSPQDDDDYGQIDDFRSHHDAVSQIRHSAGVGVHEEVDAAIGLAKPKTSLTPAAKTLAPQTRVAEGSKPPFDKPYTTIKGVVTDKSGAKHTPMSRARDIARMAMKKQVEKMKQPVKESLDESRRMEIVREAMKVAKKKKETMAADDKYQAEPMLSSQITKT
jgi:hypothetical protein